MDIKELIERNYASVSVLEDTRDLTQWLNKRDYFVVMDEESRAVGLVTIADLQQDDSRQLIDFEMNKPFAEAQQDIKEVIELMKNNHCFYLPVYDRGRFAGVISLWAIANRLANLPAAS